MTDDDLSEKLTVGEMTPSCGGIVEGKHTIDDRPDAMLLQYATHETVLDSHSVEVPGLSLYFPSRSQSLPKLRAFIELATKRMRRDFQAGDYLAIPTS